jgi:hypothetical protein
MMEIEMRRFLWAAAIVAVLLAAVACGANEDEGPDFDTEEVPGGTLGYTEIEGEQAALGKQAALGESVTLDAGIMKGPVGEPPLEGSAVLTFSSIGTGTDIGNEARALAGGSSAAFFDSREGKYLVVYYNVKNDTEGGLQPSTHVNNSFMLVDDQGRAWSPANYYSHGFEVPYAVGYDAGIVDTRKFVEPGDTVETAIGFDVPEDINVVKLRSELLDLEVSLGG